MSVGINSGQQARVQSPHLAQEFGLKKPRLARACFTLPSRGHAPRERKSEAARRANRA
jgi:hypothetical protein